MKINDSQKRVVLLVEPINSAAAFTTASFTIGQSYDIEYGGHMVKAMIAGALIGPGGHSAELSLVIAKALQFPYVSKGTLGVGHFSDKVSQPR